ncbi:MAG: GTPase/DUF3482 domain-containing protein [Desulfobacteraceae bacterium]|nr:GTPase/DUF3482 domain-containing protein [Desulfobacteraceae bacterium]
MIPEFAVLGHPNEGKSSVVSTLTENDQIAVSRIPGETVVSKGYTVKIDNEEIIRFVDTPGFQVPQQTLSWFKAYKGDQDQIIDKFIEAHKKNEFFADDVELLSPVGRGAGIIYVVDGSRPVRNDDIAEMEILRLTGRPRMAIINSKLDSKDFTKDWQQEFRKHFNAIRIFNSNHANFIERIKMLESLKAIDQEWEPALSRVIDAFKNDWKKRNHLATSYIVNSLNQILSYSVSRKIESTSDQEQIKEKLTKTFQEDIKNLEQQLFKKIRQLYKHNLFDAQMPEYSVLQYDLFARQTWELLGLNKEQLAAAGAILGGTLGAVIDTAAAGITFGVFTAIGGAIGAGSAILGGRNIAKKKPSVWHFGSDKLQIGPNKNLQLLYILIDRVLFYYALMINRPHGKRDMLHHKSEDSGKKGFSTQLTSAQRKVCARFFKSITSRTFINEKKTAQEFEQLMESILIQISQD